MVDCGKNVVGDALFKIILLGKASNTSKVEYKQSSGLKNEFFK